VAIQSFVFNNPKLTPLTGNLIKEPTLFGLNVSIRQGRDLVRTTFAIMVLIVLGIVLLFFVRLASGSTGRAFLAVRANERAAASAGIDVRRAKILGFAIASFLAGVGGCLLGYSRGQLSAESFTVAVSLSLLAVSYLGGITSIAGALVAGLLGPLGLVYTFFDRTLSMGKYYALVSGLGLVLTAVMNPVGIAGATEENFRNLKKRFSRRSHGPPAEVVPGAPMPQAALAGSEVGHER
jgi:branched-chain amino acid transport system permease protein